MKEATFLVLEVAELARLDDFALFDDNNTSALLNGSESVCDDNGGAALHDIVECLLHHPLCFLVESTGCLVENQDVGFPNDSSGNGNSLLLST